MKSSTSNQLRHTFSYDSVDKDIPCLTETIRSVDGLYVNCWVPADIVYDHSGCSCDVQALASSFGCDQVNATRLVVFIVESNNALLPIFGGCITIHPQVVMSSFPSQFGQEEFLYYAQ